METNNRFCQCFSHCFFISTILGLLILPSSIHGSQIFLALGGNSIYISLGVFLSGQIDNFWCIASLVYSGLFVCCMITAYLFSFRKMYWPMFFVLLFDLCIVSLFFLYMMATDNMYGVVFWCFDMVVNIATVVLFARNIPKHNTKFQGTIHY